MAGNPLVDQGVLNRVRASVSFPGNTTLNVTAPFLGREGIRMVLMGEETTIIPTMTGTALSPEVYAQVEVTINLLRTQALANKFKAQMEKNTILGICIIRPDTTALAPYTIQNCAMRNLRELPMNGSDAGWVITISGYYVLNSDLWNL